MVNNTRSNQIEALNDFLRRDGFPSKIVLQTFRVSHKMKREITRAIFPVRANSNTRRGRPENANAETITFVSKTTRGGIA